MITAGEHEFVDVITHENSGHSEQYIINIDFRSHFQIARAIKSYNVLLNSIPSIYVGTTTGGEHGSVWNKFSNQTIKSGLEKFQTKPNHFNFETKPIKTIFFGFDSIWNHSLTMKKLIHIK